MNARKIACLSLLFALALPSAYANNPKKSVSAPAPRKTAPVAAQRGRAGQTQMRTQGRTAGAVGGTRSQGRTAGASRGVRTQGRTASARGGTRTGADRVYNFHGAHRGGGRYVDGRLVGRYVNDRVYVDGQWYVWQAPPLGIFGVGAPGWVVEGGAVDAGPVAAVVEPVPVIVATGPDYFVVRNGIFTRQISRADFVRTYPRYARANRITATGGRGGTASRTAAMRGTTSRTTAMRGTAGRTTTMARTGNTAARMQPARVTKAPAKVPVYKKH